MFWELYKKVDDVTVYSDTGLGSLYINEEQKQVLLAAVTILVAMQKVHRVLADHDKGPER